MAKKVSPAGVKTTSVNVLFHPDGKVKAVTLEMETGPGPPINDPGNICECSFAGIKFCHFKNTIKEGVTLMAVPMILPAFFKEIGQGKNKQDVRRLFLLRTGVTEKDCAPNKRKDFFKDILVNGPMGCPIPILMKPDHYTDRNGKKCSPNFFTFNNNRFYPFLMREFTVGYYVCDENATKDHWPEFDPKDPGIALDYPLIYDATLGLFVTRGAHYVSYKKP